MHPVIPIKIGDVTLTAVIDSGSPISVISDTVFQKCSEIMTCPTLPMQRTMIKGAIANKTLQVKQQTYLDFQCQGNKFSAHFLIVPTLSTEVILGIDFLQRHKAILDFNNSEISFQLQGKPVTIKFDDWVSQKEEQFNCFILRSDTVQQSLDIPHQTTASDGQADFSTNDQQEINVHDVIQTKIEQIVQCSDWHKQQLRDILTTHSSVFVQQPGTIKNFQYRFQVKEHTKFCVRPYPIPAHFRDQVKLEIKKC